MGVLVGKPAPDFKAQAVVDGQIVEHFSLKSFRGKIIVFFFYPLDFTFVCPTELHAFEAYRQEFEARNTVIIGCSVDSVFSHLAWLNTPKAKGGIAGVTYPLVSDINKTIAANYDVLVPYEGIAYRGLFLINDKGIVCHQVVNDLPFGRSIPEVLRMVDALNYFNQHGEVCPADWHQGKKAMKPNQQDLEKYFAATV